MIDDELAFVGGIDMTDLAGDRFDLSEHPARRRLGWHDVGTRLRGPAVADVAAHFAMRWREVSGEELAAPEPPPPAGPSTVQVVRTVAEDMYDSVPRGDFRILESYLRALSVARELVYLENQFLWAPELVDVLAAKLRHPPADSFRLVVVLPRRANNGQDDTRGQLGPPGRRRRRSGPLPRRHAALAQRHARTTRCTCTPRWGSSTTAG